MLSHLIIRNFAIIDHLEVPLNPGFTVLTGETGAGKSIVIDALNLILGGRASTSVIRKESDEAIVEAAFHLAAPNLADTIHFLQELGIACPEQTLTIRRIITRSGRNKVVVNDSLVNLTTLQKITRHLVDISGQHEHYSLIEESEHLAIVDRYGRHQDDIKAYRECYDKVRELRKELKFLQSENEEHLQRIDFLKFLLKELQEAQLEVGEEERLKEEYQRLKNAEKIATSVGSASYLLTDGSGCALDAVREAREGLRQASHHVSGLETLIARLGELEISIDDISHELNTQYRIEEDPARLDAVQGRLEVLKRLQRKHNRDIDDLILYAEDLAQQLDFFENNEAHQERVKMELARAEARSVEAALALSKKRQKVATHLADLIMQNLAQLNMARAIFVIENETPIPENAQENQELLSGMLTPLGLDTMTFKIAPNPGESPKPLAKIASGGELSRIMLAIKTILADQDNFSTYIFDEVDTGISGETADSVGEMITTTSKDRQVICITHLPQIASRADYHLLVEKRVENERTISTVRELETDGKVEEIARMLGGTRVTEATLAAARELIAD